MHASLLGNIITWIVNAVSALGYWGIIAMMFLESSFFPFPSEVVIPPAGYLASQGRMSFPWVIACGILGSLLGALFNYYLALWLGRPLVLKIARPFGLTEEKFARAEEMFRTHGEISTFVCRLLPVIRQYISFPAGLARMNLFRFLLFTGLGASIWVTILAYIGYLVGNNKELIQAYSHKSLTYIVIAVVILTVLYVIWHKKWRKKPTKESTT
jgi:membrane protein DedA with SNARE-associated domain